MILLLQNGAQLEKLDYNQKECKMCIYRSNHITTDKSKYMISELF